MAGQPPAVLNKSDFQPAKVSNMSLMPEGLLKTPTDREVRDLAAYLYSIQQVPL